MRISILPFALFSCLCSFFLFACANDNNAPAELDTPHSVAVDSPVAIPPIVERQVTGMPVVLIVRTSFASAYKRPDFSAPIVANYQKEDSLIFTNRISEQHSLQTLEGLNYQEPWLRIILPNQEMAWIYGAHVSFDAQAQPELAKLVLYPRAAALFGDDLAQQMSIYQKEMANTLSLPGFRTLYTRAQYIKDSLEVYLANYALTSPQHQTDFFWLNELLDGLLLHYIPEKKEHYLFRNLSHWKTVSLQTPDNRDDAFMDLLLACYPTDSIAYYYYGWQLPLENQRWCSLLGSGIHSEVFNQLNNSLDSSSYFRPEITHIKQELINDIATSRYYWMPLPAVQNELDSILQKNYPFLNSGDRVALKTKRTFLEAPQKHQLVLNLFEEG